MYWNPKSISISRTLLELHSSFCWWSKSVLVVFFSDTFWRKSFSYFRFVKISWRVYKYPVINLRQAPPFANLQTSVNLKRYPSPLSYMIYLISSAAILSQIVLSPAVFLTCPVLSPRKINEKGTPWYYQFILRIDLCGKWLFFLCSQPLSYPVRILFMQIDRLQLKETMFKKYNLSSSVFAHL